MECCIKVCKFCHNYLWWILGVLSLLIVLFSDNAIGDTLRNILCSIFAASLFNLLLVYIPNRYRAERVKVLIDNDFFKIQEYARLCKQSITSTFGLEEKKWDSEEDYVDDFCQTDLYGVWAKIGDCSYTKLQRIEYLRDEIKNILNHLMIYQEYFSFEQFKVITQVLSSNLFKKDIEAIIWDMPKELRINKSNNQKEIGRSIYKIYDDIRKYNQQK